RDPHLAALGFVWQPLPSAVLVPLLPFKVIWPALTQEAFAIVIESALSMAGCVWVVSGITRDLGLSAATRWTIVGLFAVHPMIVYYGANGMSEALMLLPLLLVTRYLIRWTVSRSLRDLTLTGV